MDPADKALAEAVLRRLCVGAQIDGIRFGPILQLLITDHTGTRLPVAGQVYLNLGARWQIFAYRQPVLPRGEDALPEFDAAEELRLLCELRDAEVERVELATDAPDLVLTFTDGRVLFVNGRHDRYESWQLGVAFAGQDEPWLVVACPGGGVAVWAPSDFDRAAPVA